MLQVCWSPKGGSGTSVVAAAIAVQSASSGHDTVLVDLAGDQGAILGVEDSEGVGDWFAAADDVGPDALPSLEMEIGPHLRLLPRGVAPEVLWSAERIALAMALFARRPGLVVVDGGRQSGSGLPANAATVVVIRSCYLAIRRVAAVAPSGGQVVVIEEPGRSLSRRDIGAVLGQIEVVLPWDPAVARAVDAGLLATRLPRSLRPLRRLGLSVPGADR